MVLSFTHNNKLLHIDKANVVERNELCVMVSSEHRDHRGVIEKKNMMLGDYIPSGFWRKCIALKKKGFKVDITNFNDFTYDISEREFADYVKSLNIHFRPYDYQMTSAYRMLKYPVSRVELSPGAGKTLLCWILANILLDKVFTDKSKSVLIIVPRVPLVTQTAKNFETAYSDTNKIICDTVYAKGKEKEGSNVVVGCLNSLVNKPKEYFHRFGAVLVDESHNARTKSIQTILDKKLPVSITHINGCTGTSPEDADNDNDTLMAESYLGPIVYTKTQRELIDKDKSISDLHIKIVHFKIPTKYTENYFFNKLAKNEATRLLFEGKYIWAIPHIFETISKVVEHHQENHIFCFNSVEQTEMFAEKLNAYFGDKRTIHVVHGKLKLKDKGLLDRVVDDIEQGDGRIICATYKSIDTGVDFKNIHHLHLIEAGKSIYKIRQFFGRGSRLHKTKDVCMVYDYAFHFEKEESWKIKFTNIHSRQYKKRIPIYKKQELKYEHKHVKIK